MSNITYSINKQVELFRDISLRHRMINDFGYGPTYNIGASRQMKFPYIWVEQGDSRTEKSDNGMRSIEYSYTIFCMDKIDMGDKLNYDEIISDTHYILDTIIQEIMMDPFYTRNGISLVNDIIMTPVLEATDDNVNGWSCDLSLRIPIRYTTCNSPIEPKS